MAKRITEQDIKKELRALKKRLATASSHTGFQFEIDENAFLSNKDRKHTLQRMKNIRWSNMKYADEKMLKGIKITGTGTNPQTGELILTPIEEDKAAKLTKLIANREKITKQTMKANILSKYGVDASIKFYNKIQTKQEWEEWKQKRNDHAYNNILNNIEIAAQATGDEGLRAILEYVKSIDKNTLLKYYSKQKFAKLSEQLGFNIFDSDTEIEIKSNGVAFIKALLEYMGQNSRDVARILIDSGLYKDPNDSTLLAAIDKAEAEGNIKDLEENRKERQRRLDDINSVLKELELNEIN